MDVLLSLVLPFFAIIAVGYGVRWQGLLNNHAVSALNDFVYWIALPPLLFRAMALVQPDQLLNWNFIGVYGGSVLITMLLAWWVSRMMFRLPADAAAMSCMNAAYGNTGFLGLPLSVAAFGALALPPTIITVVINTAVTVGITTIVIEFSRQAAVSRGWLSVLRLVGKVCWAVLKNPMILSPILGIAYASFGFALPEAIDQYCTVMGAAATPCALFCVGMFLYGKKLSDHRPEVACICGMKLILQPLLCLILMVAVFPLSPLHAAVAVVMAATPTGAGSFVLAKFYGLSEAKTSSIILVSTLLSILSLFLLLQYYLDILGK